MSSATYYAGGTVTYYTAAGQPAFNTVATIGLPVWEKVLPVPNDRVLFRQRFMQTAASYTPLAYDTVYPSNATYGVPTATTYYLVSEENFSGERGGIMTWDRVYCAVPTAWSDPEEYAYTFPSFTGAATGVAANVSSITASGSSFAVYSSMTYSTGDSVYIAVRYTRNSITYSFAAYTTATLGTSGTFALVPNIFTGSGSFSSVSGTIKRASQQRDVTKTLVVGSRIYNEYALSAVTALDSTLPIIAAFSPVDYLGIDTTALNTLSNPTSTSYQTMISTGTEIVAVASIRRRFQGNIYVRSTRYIPAQ